MEKFKNKKYSAKLNKLKQEFVESLPQASSNLFEYTKDVIEQGDDEQLQQVLMKIHNLKSVGISYHMDKLVSITQDIENILYKINEKNKSLQAREKSSIQEKLEDLVKVSDDYKKDVEKLNIQSADEIAANDNCNKSEELPLVFILDNDIHFANVLAHNIQRMSINTRIINNLEKLDGYLAREDPDILITDLFLNSETPRHSQAFVKINEIYEHTLHSKILYVGKIDDINTRLQAIRAHGDSFLQKSFSLFELRNVIEGMLPIREDEKPRVLIIDDDHNMTTFCAAILEQANIEVEFLNDTFKIFQTINKYNPDVILMDMYMPKISGTEMANIIRQHQAYMTIPIVIMSSETDMNMQFYTRSVGADDFILKPFKPRHLVDVISNRIKRSRYTKKLIYTDGLTGIDLFPKIRDNISNIIDSCLRYKLDFSIGLIDLDLFKSVNDTYGHLVGDGILRDLADFLSCNIRKSDIVARYGGEEFVIIFPYTNMKNAYIALDKLREKYFEEFKDHLEGRSLSFSGGVSGIERYNDVEAIIANADEGLYLAKENGRNRVEIYPPTKDIKELD